MHEPEPVLNGKRKEIDPFGPPRPHAGRAVVTVGAVSGITWVVAIATGVAARLLGSMFLPPRAPALSFVGLGGFWAGALGGAAIAAIVAARLFDDEVPRKAVFVGAMLGVTLIGGVMVLSLSEARIGLWMLSAFTLPVAGPLMALGGLLAPGIGAVVARAIMRARLRPRR